MHRRNFLSTSLAAGLGIAATARATSAAEAEAKTGSSDSAAADRKLLFGHPVVSGPDAESLTILHAVNGPASGFVELAVDDGPFRRIDAETAGLLPYDEHVLKVRLPPLPAGRQVRYRVVARSIEFKTDYDIRQGEPATAEAAFRTLDPKAESTRFVVWNDTHEHQKTIERLQQLTGEFRPDFLLWNGDQTNNVHDPVKMRAQYLAPGELEIASRWPLAYARGNHDLRGPAARQLARFTGTPDDRFYYAFRSGPLAALVMDTGEDKPDDRDAFAGLAAFEQMRQRQRQWLAGVIEEPWFRSAPYRILFCHIPLWWIKDNTETGLDFWLSSDVCREAWLPLLEQAGVQLVVSGHTHHATWMPKSDRQPISQLVGGGPQFDAATITECTADERQLTLACKRLDGTLLHEVRIAP